MHSELWAACRNLASRARWFMSAGGDKGRRSRKPTREDTGHSKSGTDTQKGVGDKGHIAHDKSGSGSSETTQHLSLLKTSFNPLIPQHCHHTHQHDTSVHGTQSQGDAVTQKHFFFLFLKKNPTKQSPKTVRGKTNGR